METEIETKKMEAKNKGGTKGKRTLKPGSQHNVNDDANHNSGKVKGRRRSPSEKKNVIPGTTLFIGLPSHPINSSNIAHFLQYLWTTFESRLRYAKSENYK
jgi:hypothetical protein